MSIVEIPRPAPYADEAEADLAAVEWLDEMCDRLLDADVSTYTDEQLTAFAHRVETVRRKVDTAVLAVADEVDRAGRFRRVGYFSAKAWLKRRLRISGPEAHRRVQTARMYRRLPEWADAQRAGTVGVEQGRAMAQVVANPRVEPHLDEAAPMLLDDAQERSFDEFDRRLRLWEELADRAGARTRAQLVDDGRDVRIRQRADGSWKLTGSFGARQGAEVNELLAHFNDAEWRADWAAASSGADGAGDVSVSSLRRTEAQRRADALLAALLAGATALPSAARPEPTVNILVDHVTFGSWLRGDELDPLRYREVVCRTQRGDRLPIDEACGAALWALARRVVTDGASTVIDLGRRRRLFTGSAREAVMLLDDRCLWPGCDRPVSWCEADHSLGWKQHGATVPRNGGPLCKRHNLLKERGSFRAWRCPDGEWHVTDADGNEVE